MIEFKGISKSFGNQKVVDNIDLSIREGEFFCLLGPSGCGKTTLLRLVAGLEKPDAGTLRVGNRDVTSLPPHKRECALVFQNYALWPHLTVGENISYGLEIQKKPREEIRKTLSEFLSAYQLEGLQDRLPHQLSGGQQQRVALARAMVMRPQALLMDEPLSNLDAALRKTLRRELLDFHRRARNTILYVTHDQEEALALSDRVAVIMQGRVVECGSPRDLYAHPERLETALFLGDMNVLREGKAEGGMYRCGELVLPHPAGKGPILCIRPENLRVSADTSKPADENDAWGNLDGTLAFVEFMGTHANASINTSVGPLLARVGVAEAAAMTKEQKVRVGFPAESVLWY